MQSAYGNARQNKLPQAAAALQNGHSLLRCSCGNMRLQPVVGDWPQCEYTDVRRPRTVRFAKANLY